MRRFALVVVLAVTGLSSSRPRSSAEGSSAPLLVEGKPVTLLLSPETLAASAVIHVPAGVEALHVFVSIGLAVRLEVEEGPIDETGAFTESIRQAHARGRAHLSRTVPTMGLHRLIVRRESAGALVAHVEIAFDRPGSPPVVDLASGRLTPGSRRVRFYVPPHEGAARLELTGPADEPIRVLFRNRDGTAGEPATLPLDLPGTEPGGLFELDVLRGVGEGLRLVRLAVSPAGTVVTSSESAPARLELGTPTTLRLGDGEDC